MIEYRKMSLFDAPDESIIIHAVNAQGVWGSGIAKEFKDRYPEVYNIYKGWCLDPNSVKLGKSEYAGYTYNNPAIGWICTSENYGSKKDSKTQILVNTTLALNDLLFRISWDTIYSNKFNSGLFGVPWEETEVVLKEVLKHHPSVTWIICDPNMDSDDSSR